MELKNIQGATLDIEDYLDSVKECEIWVEVGEDHSSFYIGQEQAEEIIMHLKKVFKI